MRTVRLHDTRTGGPVELRAGEGGRVGIYACGPTVYSRVHVGNARPYVVFSLLARFLRHEGYDPVLVANVTDINDKIYDAARAAGRPSDELAREMTAHYVADTDRLGLGRPDHEPLATEMVAEIEALIAELLERGHAYAVDGDVYFRVRSLPGYGELSHRDVDEMDQGEGVEGAERKEDPLDFALWKAQKPFEDTAWDAPWGRGRPGWHIECSAMAEALLGVEFEVHGGGIDLVFPHHENEAAQTLAARGPPARPHLDAQRHGRAGRRPTARRRCPSPSATSAASPRCSTRSAATRSSCTSARATTASRSPTRASASTTPHGASSGSATPAGASSPATRRPALAPHREAFFAALADDFNTPRALAALSEWIREANKVAGAGERDLREMLDVLGLANLLERGEGPPEEVLALAGAARRGARPARLRRGRPPPGRAAGPRLGRPRRARRSRAGARGAVTVVRPPGRCPRGRDRLRPQRRAGGPARPPPGAAGVGDARRREGVPRRPRSPPRTRSPAAAGSRRRTRACAPTSRTIRYADAAALLRAPDPVLVALDEVTDPQNLGAVCRSAECAGATGVVIPERRSAEVTAAVCKASAGAVEHLPVARVRNLADFLAEAKAAGLLVLRRGGRRAHRLPGRRLARPGRARARRGGSRAASAGRRELRRPRLAAAARAHRLAQHKRRRGGRSCTRSCTNALTRPHKRATLARNQVELEG